MQDINYSWSDDNSDDEILSTDPMVSQDDNNTNERRTGGRREKDLSTRHNIQIMRRMFHMFTGVSIATLYLVSFDHSQMIHFLGTIAALLYLLEQVRVNYPEASAKILPFTRFVMRAEEQLKESAMVPYAMAVLLTIVAFPKHIALIGIYSLAFADPLSAIIGIRFGKHKITPTRSVEGSLAFFFSVFFVTLFVLTGYNGEFGIGILMISLVMGALGAGFDMIPLKLDDNLTIPLFVSTILWVILNVFGIFI